jgi:hypothetical protein
MVNKAEITKTTITKIYIPDILKSVICALQGYTSVKRKELSSSNEKEKNEWWKPLVMQVIPNQLQMYLHSIYMPSLSFFDR